MSTIHSKSAAQTINKIIDSFPAEQQNQIRIQLSETLTAIISQRLLKRKD
jgi:twitching motility protein PilT